MPAKLATTPKRGRPATGTTRTKISVSLPDDLLKLAKKKASKGNESFSSLAARSLEHFLAQ